MSHNSVESLFSQAFVRAPLRELAPEFPAVFAPEGQKISGRDGVTAQFIENAEEHHDKYFDTAYSDYMVKMGLDRVVDLPSRPLVLDIGSGSGNSVFSGLKMIPGSRIIASDISPNLLAIMNRIIPPDQRRRVDALCLDLNEGFFKEDSFDLAIGMAILHHLFDPKPLLLNVYKAMKPGASMVFFEPFEAGYVMISMIYKMILVDARIGEIAPDVARFMQGKRAHLSGIKCEPKSIELFKDVDDKIFFTRKYFGDLCEEIGASLIIEPINPVERQFARQVEIDLKLGLGRDKDALPQWAWDGIDEVEDAVSESCRHDILLECFVVITKRAEQGHPSSGGLRSR